MSKLTFIVIHTLNTKVPLALSLVEINEVVFQSPLFNTLTRKNIMIIFVDKQSNKIYKYFLSIKYSITYYFYVMSKTKKMTKVTKTFIWYLCINYMHFFLLHVHAFIFQIKIFHIHEQ